MKNARSLMRRGVAVAVVVAFAVLLAGTVGGAGAAGHPRAFVPDDSAVLAPADYPNDPSFAACETRDPSDDCGGSEQWNLYGKLTGDTCRAPGSSVADQPHPDGGLPCWAYNAKDPQHASGINETGAWAQGNYGRGDMLIAYIEGGVNYDHDNIKQGLNNIYLNPGESPYPEDRAGHDKGTLDYDGNGRFDIRDYADDPRVNPDCPSGVSPFSTYEEGTTRGCVNGGQHAYLNTVHVHNVLTKYLSPEDLIAVFGHCKIVSHELAGCPKGGKFDNDGNGYPNDVSGWNTYRNNNDPQTEDGSYSHASGLIAEEVAQRDDHYGGIGTCPDCRVVPIKQGAECLGLSNKWAEALLYATNLGAKVISSVVVSYQYSSYGREAVEYANKKGVLLAFDSNDFDSTDHTDGMMYPHAIPGNGVVPDDNNLKSDDVHWFRARSNVTSYGPHHIFSGMETTTSGATPFMAGMLAMTQSAALNARDAGTIPRAFTPNEVKQALMDTASSIVPQTQAPTVTRQWPGNPNSHTDATHTNWSTQYGYGRIDLGAATALIKSGAVPPTTEITSPDWYAYVDPAKDKTLPISGYVKPSAWRSGGVNWTLEWAVGADPSDSDFHTISTGTGAKSGVLGTLNLASIPAAYAAKAPSNTNTPNGPQNYAVTLRIRALDGNGLKAEDRRTVTARTDPQLVRHTHVGGEPAGGATYADLEGRHEQDLIVGTADGELLATRPDGTHVPSFPRRTWKLRTIDPNDPENYPAASYKEDAALRDARDPISGTAVGDLDHDGNLDVVATTNNAYVYAWSNRGKLLPGFPVHTPTSASTLPVPTPITATAHSRRPARGNWSPPVLADLEGNGQLDIVMTAFDGHVYAWQPDGKPVPGWPVEIKPTAAVLAAIGADPAKLSRDPKLMYSVGVGDLLGTGHPQVFVGGFDCANDKKDTFVYGIQPDGTKHAGGAYLPGWPVALNSLVGCYDQSIDFVEEGTSPPVVMPVGGVPRVVVSSVGNSPVVLDGHGTKLKTMSPACSGPACAANPPYFPGDSLTAAITGQGGAGDLTGSGQPNFVQSVVGALSTENAVSGDNAGQAALGQSYEKAWDPVSGLLVSGFPARQDGFSFFDAPLVAGLGQDPAHPKQRAAIEANDSSWIHAYEPDGTEAPGFPKYVGQWPSFSGVTGDPKLDGSVNVAFGTREGDLFEWKTQGTALQNDQWWHFHHDERNTNQWGLDTRRPSVPPSLKVKRKGSRVTVTFTAPGDDGATGTAKAYAVRASTKRLYAAKPFGPGKRVKAPVPLAAGTTQKLTITSKKTVWVALRSSDDAGNLSATSVVRSSAPRPKAKRKHHSS